MEIFVFPVVRYSVMHKSSACHSVSILYTITHLTQLAFLLVSYLFPAMKLLGRLPIIPFAFLHAAYQETSILCLQAIQVEFATPAVLSTLLYYPNSVFLRAQHYTMKWRKVTVIASLYCNARKTIW